MAPFIASRIIQSLPLHPTQEERTRVGNTASILGIVLNVALCCAKGIVGLFVGSVSIVADAINNLSDAASSIVSLVGFKLASRPADDTHPFGHGRFEYLAGLVVSVMVCAVGLELILTSIRRIAHPEPVEFGPLVAAVLIASIALKLWIARFDRLIGSHIASTTLEATSVDARNDAIASTAVLICALVSHVWGISLDGFCGAGVGLFVLYSGIQLVRDTTNPLLGQAPDSAYVEHVRNTILSYPGVLGTHDLMIHDYGPGRLFASAHVEMALEESALTCHDTLDRIEQDFKDREGLIISLHLDPIVTDDPREKDLRNWISSRVQHINPELAIHDLRTVSGPAFSEIAFDVAVPEQLEIDDAELERTICELVHERRPDAHIRLTIDHSYISARQ